MKYIILQGPTGPLPVIFPDVLVHAFVAGAMQLAIDAMDPKKNLRPEQCLHLLERGIAKPVSAGFISMGVDFAVHGESETLALKSRSELDEAIIGLGEQAGALSEAMMVALWAKAKEHFKVSGDDPTDDLLDGFGPAEGLLGSNS